MQSAIIKRAQLPLFFLLCLIISWIVWIPQALTKLNSTETHATGGSPLNILAVWAPAISAILLSRLVEGKSGPQMLLQSLRHWHVNNRWYLFAILYPATIWLLARAIDHLFGRPFEFMPPILSYFPVDQSCMVVVALVFAFPNALGEEIGWRGFALPRLQAKYNALTASVLLGLFWAVWHIPMWIANDRTGFDLLRSMLTIIAYTIIFTWVYNSTSGSLLLSWLFHASITITQYILQTPLTLTDDIARWGVAIFVVIMMGATHLSSNPRTVYKIAPGV